MTVSSTANKVSYSGNGSLDTFAYTFKIFADSDLKVFIRTSAGTETLKTISTHYTVTNAGVATGGNVVFTSGNIPASGETVVIQRELTLTQGTDYVENDPFPAQSHEDALDRLTFVTQQMQEELDRSIKASVTNTITNSEFTVSATDRANKVFAFDASGNLSVTQELGTNRGDWAASTSYAVRDLVKDTSTNNIFIVNEAHTSSGSQPLTTNANSAKYDLIVDAASATTSASAAASSATAAASSASTASTQASNASTSASTSSTQASNAASSATAAASSATAAAASATSAAASLDAFDDNYLGAKSSDPSTDNDGDALTAGDLYFNTSSNVLKVYNGSAWQEATLVTTATTAELNYSDTGAAVGTVVASKVVTADANKDVASFRNITLTGELDAGSLDVSGDADIDGTLEADAMTLNGTAITATATLDTGISNNNVPKFTSGVADNDFLRVDGTAIEGRSASEVLSDIAAAPAAGDSNIVTTGALNSGSITSGFGAIDNGSSNITTTGVGTFGSLDISGDIDVDGTTNLDAVDIDGAVDMASTLQVDGAITSSAGATITTADNTTQLTLKSTDADGSVGPKLDLVRESSSPADDDNCGQIQFKVDNDAGESIVYGDIFVGIIDASDGTEDAHMTFKSQTAGARRSRMEIQPTETVFNQDSQDIDFRVESDLQMAAFFVEGSTGNISIGHNTPILDSSIAGTSVPSGTKYVHVNDGEGAVIKLTDPADGANRGAQFAIINTTAFLNNCETGGLILGSGNTGVMTISGSQDTAFFRNGGVVVTVNRGSDDGALISLQQGSVTEGIISVSGNTVTYGDFCGSHWTRLADNSKPTILRGTVIETIDQMCTWYQAEYEYDGETKKESIALPEGKSVGDTFTYETTTLDPNEKITVTAKITQEKNVKHTMGKVSDTADSKKVYGVFLDWDNDEIDEVNDMNICSVGTNLVRVHKDVTVEAGDLLSSNGDGTAKVQDDDIIRSKTIGKVLAAVKQETHSDGSYTVPCALYCG